MKKLTKIFVSEKSFNSEEHYDIIYSNNTFVKLLLSEGTSIDKIHDDAVYSYYVDYYDQEMKKGNFSRFVIESKWDSNINSYILKGLEKIEAYNHLIYFKNMIAKVENLGKDSIDRLINSDYLGVNDLRDYLDDDLEFFMIDENIDEYNSKWLKNHPDLYALPFNQIYIEIEKFLGYKFTNY